ncbi:helix-turn-helix domain-containing protein [Pluralibacter gergoviae]
MENKLLKTKQAAELLEVSPRTITALIKSGGLAGKKVGRGYKTTERACIAYIESTTQNHPANTGEVEGKEPCQSPNETGYGTVISLRQQAKELGGLLTRGTKSRLRNSTIS